MYQSLVHFEERTMKMNKILICLCVISGLLAACFWHRSGLYDKDMDQLKETILHDADSSADIKELQSIASDAIGWIRIPGTSIDYPLLQGKDNDFYLTHDLYGRRNTIGSVFIDYSNDPQLQDPLTLIYGHNVLYGGIFSELHLYEDPAYLLNHKYVMLYVESNLYTYEVIALHKVSIDDFDDFVKEHYDADRMQIALVTCFYGNEWSIYTNMRFILLAERI